MTRVLLVDDEDYIRQGMRLTIPWEEYDMEIVGEASNGADALQIAIRTGAEIVLADIQMPVMGGLELAKELHLLLPHAKVIILTAYGNTENLTNAIDLKVSSFLLKSADSGKILETVLKVKEELDSKRERLKEMESMKGIFDENRQLIKGTLLTRFLENQISFSHFSKKGEPLDFALHGSSYALAIIKCNYVEERRAIGQFLQYFSIYRPFCYFIRDRTAVLLLDTSLTPLETCEIEQLLPSILPLAFGNFITIMHHIPQFEDMPLAYSILTQALEYCFWNHGSPYTLLSTDDGFASERKVNPYAYEREIIRSVISRGTASIQEQFEKYQTYMEREKAPRQSFLESIMRLVVLISAVSSEDISISDMEAFLHELETPDEILEAALSLALPGTARDYPGIQLEPVLEYIRAHCCESLYLEDVAKAAYLSPGYLSRIFKHNTGFSFKEYVHKLRIEEAQRLICTTDMKYYEVAEKVGYKNYKYFSSYFSKITGCSAKEYRGGASHRGGFTSRGRE